MNNHQRICQKEFDLTKNQNPNRMLHLGRRVQALLDSEIDAQPWIGSHLSTKHVYKVVIPPKKVPLL